jgi:hypothetical protein
MGRRDPDYQVTVASELTLLEFSFWLRASGKPFILAWGDPERLAQRADAPPWGMPMPVQQITITLSNDTIQALQGMGYALYAMQKFNTTSAAGKPMVWRAMTTFANSMAIDFDIEYAAYMSEPAVSDSVIIVRTTAKPVQLGQTATLGDDFALTITTGGRADAVTLVNGTTQRFTTGLADHEESSTPVPLIAVPLYGLGEAIVGPLDQFLLTFSTQGLAPGTPIDHSMSQSLLIDMSGQTAVTVSYDINTGWNVGETHGTQLVKAGTPLAPILAHQMPML